MSTCINRREFLLGSTSIAIGGALLSSAARARPAASATGIRKGACIGVLPEGMTVREKFETAKRAGFDGVEPNTLKSAGEVKDYREAAERSGLAITSIMNSDHWDYPLSDNDPEVVRKSVECIKTSLQNAHDLDAGAVLLVPGVVTANVRYADVYTRSQAEIRKLLPMAEELKVIIAIENVGNRFLLSPLEMARYVDEFKSPWVRSYFDIGNVVATGFPQDWIRTLDKRVCRMHIKRFEPGTDHPKFDPKDRRTQGIDWPDVHRALSEIGYKGWITAEVKSGDENYVKEVGARLDRILSGQDPV
ncbi:MAG TPA: sugar phosphate isomerase/epimerase family protein [Terriglobia bacterium]|nr:sugar phosphate isomerase/epimerase family protein [Terriglobia bacterium]